MPVPLVLQAGDPSLCHSPCEVLPNPQKVMKLMSPVSLVQGHQLSSADMRLFHRGGKQSGENK